MKNNNLCEYDWIGHPECEKPDNDCRVLIDRRDEIVVFGYVEDAEADYSYDDYALIKLDNNFYLLNTEGCSCPSPTATWGIVYGPTTLDEIETHLKDADGRRGYGVTKRQNDEFMGLVALARSTQTQ